jgi:FkbM family methyltransferase
MLTVDALYWKHLLVRTPLEGVAKRLQHWLKGFKVLRHPGLQEVYREDGRIGQAMRRILRPWSNCVDVGAHIGGTISLILNLAPKGKHVAVEPLARKAAWLGKKFPEVQVHQLALGDTAGKIKFCENLSRPGFSGFQGDPASGDRTREVLVDCARLDDIIPSDRRIDFLKVDVEGAELLVLRGATSLLARDRPVVLFESGPGGAEKLGLSREQLFRFFVKQGYSVFLPKDYVNNGNPLELSAFDQSHRYPFKAFNYFAIPRGS